VISLKYKILELFSLMMQVESCSQAHSDSSSLHKRHKLDLCPLRIWNDGKYVSHWLAISDLWLQLKPDRSTVRNIGSNEQRFQTIRITRTGYTVNKLPMFL